MIVVDAAGDAWRMFPPDMLRSANGWPASSDPDDLDLVWITVATRRFRVKRVAATPASVRARIGQMGL